DNTGCLIEHFGNADAVPQPPERCLSRQAGIVRCCPKASPKGAFSSSNCHKNMTKVLRPVDRNVKGACCFYVSKMLQYLYKRAQCVQ
ncbi:MAG: hypothetical protein KHY36_11590, partial [Subdoligranulum variabile]|nr:hypothetical protein [Subdoligranulum variabile]